MNFLTVIFIVCTSQFVLLGVFLIVHDKAVRFGMRWLGAFFLALALNFLDGMLFLNGFYLEYPNLAFLEDPNVFLFGPFLYFFARSLSQDPPAKNWMMLLHFIPFLLCLALVTSGYHLQDQDFKLSILERLTALEFPPQAVPVLLIVFTHFFLYAYLARKKIQKYRRRLKGYYSSAEIQWSLKILDFLLVIFSISFGSSLLEYAGNPMLFKVALTIVAVATTIFIFQILLRALHEPLFRIPYEKEFGKIEADGEELRIRDRITHLLDTGRIFKSPELSLADLSAQLDIPSRQVSYVINKHLAGNFYELVNEYRIREAQRLLKSGMTVTEVMFESGFNSKSSFNTQFRKFAGTTPTAFRKMIREN